MSSGIFLKDLQGRFLHTLHLWCIIKRLTAPSQCVILLLQYTSQGNHMTEIRIRKVEDWVAESLRQRARSKGQSLEAALRALLLQEALRPKQELANELRQMRAELREKYGTFSESAALIREDRDVRG
jgi:plasmid stability protein